jgi:hypothetical protein
MLSHFTLVEMLQIKNPQVLQVATLYVPGHFPWLIFAIGEALILASVVWYFKWNRS